MGTKTFRISDLLEKVNHRNRVSTCSSDVRAGWNSIMSGLLIDSGNYEGFSYLTVEEVPDDHKPGIIRGKDGAENVFPDETRRIYHANKNTRND